MDARKSERGAEKTGRRLSPGGFTDEFDTLMSEEDKGRKVRSVRHRRESVYFRHLLV